MATLPFLTHAHPASTWHPCRDIEAPSPPPLTPTPTPFSCMIPWCQGPGAMESSSVSARRSCWRMALLGSQWRRLRLSRAHPRPLRHPARPLTGASPLHWWRRCTTGWLWRFSSVVGCQPWATSTSLPRRALGRCPTDVPRALWTLGCMATACLPTSPALPTTPTARPCGPRCHRRSWGRGGNAVVGPLWLLVRRGLPRGPVEGL